MRVYAHAPYILRGYTRLNHEAIQFNGGEAKDVPQEIGEWLLGTYPLTFCKLRDNEDAARHHCPLGGPVPIIHREMDSPPYHTEIQVKKRGWPKGRPRKVAA